MNVAALVSALGIPKEALVEQRVPKKLLLEQGAPTAADKRQIQDGIEEITWVAALKPANIGVPAFRDAVREYLEIAVLTVMLRSTAKPPRLIELIHRAIPYPLVLITQHGDGVNFSLAHKRWSQGEAGKVVIEDVRQIRLTLLNDMGPRAVVWPGSSAMPSVRPTTTIRCIATGRGFFRFPWHHHREN